MAENSPVVSIIMPVYKVEDYVGRAIESIQAQTFQDWELLAVDDGSPDRSGEICEEYAADDARIKVFHQVNSGAPAARNMAMARANGKYYYFMDSDDWAEPRMLEDMVALAERDGSDLVVTGFFIDTYYTDTEYRTDILQVEPAVYRDRQSFREDAYRLFDKNQLYSPWNKLWRRSYIDGNGVRYPQTFWDDFPFILDGIRDIGKVTVASEPYYHFIRKRAESETAAYRPEMYAKREEEHSWMKELYSYWGVNDAKSREVVARRYIERFIGCLENLTNPSCTLSHMEKRREVSRMIRTPNVRRSLKVAHPHSAMMRLMLFPIKIRSTSLCLLEAKVITFVKTRNTRVFSALKAGR